MEQKVKSSNHSIHTKTINKMTPEEKLNAFSRLYFTAWEIKKSSIKKQYPDLSDQEINQKVKEIFLYARS